MGLKKILTGIAPIAASFIPGGGLLAETAKKMLTGKLGIPESSSDEAIERAISEAPPEVLARIRESDNELKIALGRQRLAEKELGIRREEAYLDDRQDARQMRVKSKSRITEYLSYGVIGGTFLIFFFVGRMSLDDFMAGLVLGYAANMAKDILGFWFGTSQNSEEQGERMEEIVRARGSSRNA